MFKTFLLLTFVPMVLSVEIQLTNGRIKGTSVRVDRQMLHLFKGIPFAQPPLGRLRFQKPQPAANWTGVLDATEYGNACMTNISRSDYPTVMSEDCLYINVFTSGACLKNGECPVFILVHGGAFVFGNSVQYNDTQILERFVKYDIVFVLPAYRVSFFGFLDLGHDYEDAPYNVGLYDIIANLEWVRNEIRNFGGNSRLVTLMGYSSGATAIEYLLSSPKFQNHELFQQVMLSSGLPVMAPGYSKNVTQMLLDIANCSIDHSTNQSLVVDKKLECLRSISAEQLNLYSGQLKQYWLHLEPQSNKDLMPFVNYIKMAERRKSLPLLVITAAKEMGLIYEPEDTVEHVCTKLLHSLNYYQKATIDACIARYNDTYHPVRDFYHAVATMECIVNSGGRNVDLEDHIQIDGVGGVLAKGTVESKKTIKKGDGDAVNVEATTYGKNTRDLEGLANRDTRPTEVEGVKNLEDVADKETGIDYVEETFKRGRKASTKSPDKFSHHPCYLGIFAQVNHSNHADDILYMVGQHRNRYSEFTINDILMDKFYPKLIRNFAKGLPPIRDWLPTNEKGENYYLLDFEVTSPNRSERKWPTIFEADVFSKENVDFFLNYLLMVERNSSQFYHSNDTETFGVQGFLEMSKMVDNASEWNEPPIEESHEHRLRGYDHLHGYTSFWVIFPMIGAILLCTMFLRENGRRRIQKAGYERNERPIYPVIEKNLRYGAI